MIYKQGYVKFTYISEYTLIRFCNSSHKNTVLFSDDINSNDSVISDHVRNLSFKSFLSIITILFVHDTRSKS